MPKPAPTFPLAHIAEKEPTQLHKNFAEWVEKETGVEVDLKTLQMAVVLRIPFQRSEANQEHIAERKESKATREAELEQRRQERADRKVALEQERKEKAATKGAKGGNAKAAKTKAAAKTAEADPADVAAAAGVADETPKPKPVRKRASRSRKTTEPVAEAPADDEESDETDF